MAIEKDLNVGANLYPTESGVAELGNSSKKWKIDASQLTGTITATTATKLGSSTVGGAAKPIYLNGGTATACSSTVGSTTKPIYMNAGTITACSYTLKKSVPSDAVFTDTTYSVATTSANGLMSSADKSKLDNLIVVSSTQPTSSDCKIWIKI